MSGNIVTQSAQGACDHQGTATPSAVVATVLINKEPIVATPASYSVAGCPYATNATGLVPCVTLNFSSGATKVKASGQFVLLSTATATAIGPLPVQGTGKLNGVQTKVSAK